jgi:hypothetical protein
MMSKTIAIDFDGVINAYSGFKGKGVFENPVQGAKDFINRLRSEGWSIIIHTTRSEEKDIENYLNLNGIEFDYINFNPDSIKYDCSTKKPLADVYLDDRGIRFNGDWVEAYEKINSSKEWWRS